MDPQTPTDHDTPSPEIVKNRDGWLRRSFNPFRIATLRGLAVALPPLLTLLVFIWAWSTVERVILAPVEGLLKHAIAWSIEDVRPNDEVAKDINEAPQSKTVVRDGETFYNPTNGPLMSRVENQWLPSDVVEFVDATPSDPKPTTAHEYYKSYVSKKYLKRHFLIPTLLSMFLALMYLIGKLLAVGIGRIFWKWFESFIDRIPIIRNVYSSVKQVTDFAFSDNNIEFNRVVALEYPRKGIWSIGFVTGESFNDLRNAVGEPVLSVLMPTSPMPMTGFTITIPKSETIELDITIDQAIQFCVSCGVVVPGHQMQKTTEGRKSTTEVNEALLTAQQKTQGRKSNSTAKAPTSENATASQEPTAPNESPSPLDPQSDKE